jgi:diadenosine tetraphosphatase ApaH/serine/threonine PP2A family protein phosphatase
MPRETIARLLDLDVATQFIQGNGDRVVLAQMRGSESSEVPPQFREVIRWVARQLPLPEDERMLATWPGTLRMEIPGIGDVLFCHATPRNDTEIFTRLTSEERLLPVFAGVNAPLVVCGHTHMQFDRTVGRTRVVNAGSVGMPFGEPGAYWLLLEPEVTLRFTRYDLARAADQVRSSSYPLADDFAANNILKPPTEKAILETFTRAELR